MEDSQPDGFIPQTYPAEVLNTPPATEYAYTPQVTYEDYVTDDGSSGPRLIIRNYYVEHKHYAFDPSGRGALFHLFLAATCFFIWLAWQICWWVLCIYTLGLACLIYLLGFWLVDIALWLGIIVNIITAIILWIASCCLKCRKKNTGRPEEITPGEPV